ncbi:hypothetical protein [Pseudescherichia vulneris]|uniref:hypothetical protein n=1 Tax=Pseudescherichia vulneris TaxID=566 RepID=UPI0028D83D4A|nr:hypothetical protein [Pseudescherichia vulneris]
MAKKYNGGPAFPVPGYKFIDEQHFTQHVKAQAGMSLRDHFASLAMQARLDNPDWLCSDERTATDAYAMADAMLSAREAS